MDAHNRFFYLTAILTVCLGCQRAKYDFGSPPQPDAPSTERSIAETVEPSIGMDIARLPPAENPPTEKQAKDPSLTPLPVRSTEEALARVRRELDSSDSSFKYELEAQENEREYSVFAIFGTKLGPDGRLLDSFPGGHCVYIFSKKTGEMQIVPGR